MCQRRSDGPCGRATVDGAGSKDQPVDAARLAGSSSTTSCRTRRAVRPWLSNLELRCAAHNRYEAEQWFGVFVREQPVSYGAFATE